LLFTKQTNKQKKKHHKKQTNHKTFRKQDDIQNTTGIVRSSHLWTETRWEDSIC